MNSIKKNILCNRVIWAALFTALFCLLPAETVRAVSRENAVVRAVRQVGPAVVNISSTQPAYHRSSPFGGDPLFERFFRDFFEPGREREYKRSSLGSGVIIDGKRGFILTNAHVIAHAGKITVILRDEQEYEADVVGADTDSDLAVLRIKADKKLPSVKMGDADDLMIGEDVIAIGNPFGFSHTVTKGVISALNRSIRTDNTIYHDFIQTDASINPGNSGGPLLNINGELIGINTAIYAKAQGIGFAIPISKARRIVSDLIQYGEVAEVWLGVTVQNLTRQMVRYFNPPGGRGVLIKKVDPKSPAHTAGIRDGDIFLSIGGFQIQSVGDFNSAMKGYAPGETIRLVLWRSGKRVKMAVKAAVFPLKRAGELGYDLIGVKVTDAGRSDYASEGAVIQKVRRGSYLFEVGVRAGDVIRKMDEKIIRNRADFERAVVEYRNKGSVVLLVQRGDQGYYITVKM